MRELGWFTITCACAVVCMPLIPTAGFWIFIPLALWCRRLNVSRMLTLEEELDAILG